MMRECLPHSRVVWLASAVLLLTSCARELPTASRLPAASGQHARSVDVATVSGEVVVTLRSGTDAEQLAQTYGATVFEQNGEECGLRSDGDASVLAAAIGQDPQVLTSEPNALLEAPEARQESFAFDDGQGALQTYLEQPAAAAVRLDAAHQASLGTGVRVAILDTGIDPAHPAFAGRIEAGWDFVGNDSDPSDERDGIAGNAAFGHGTHVAGIASLTAPGARLLIARVLNGDGRGDVLSVASGVRWAVANGAQVINMSLGMLSESPAIETAIRSAEARGVIVVTSAGNWGAQDPEEFPARMDGVNAIAAADANARPAPFTSYGEDVALSAPGVGVRSAFPGGGYRLWSGTSMSSPFVAGAAALVLAQHPEWSAGQVRSQLCGTVGHLIGLSEQQIGRLGAGMLDAAAAVGIPPGFDPGSPDPPGGGDPLPVHH